MTKGPIYPERLPNARHKARRAYGSGLQPSLILGGGRNLGLTAQAGIGRAFGAGDACRPPRSAAGIHTATLLNLVRSGTKRSPFDDWKIEN